MDWSDVSLSELLAGLQEVDWGKPKSVPEFLSRFTPPPPKLSKWAARMKANVFYFRANYLVLCVIGYGVCFLRNPMALLSVLLVTCAVLTTNDNFASWLNDQLLRLIRKVHPSTALKIRSRTVSSAAPLSTQRQGYRKGQRPKVYILTIPRPAFLTGCLVVAMWLVRVSVAWLTLAWGTALGLGLPLLHATLRSPNLKAKLVNAKDEFKQMWRGYQQEMNGATGLAGLGIGPNGNGYETRHAYPDYTR